MKRRVTNCESCELLRLRVTVTAALHKALHNVVLLKRLEKKVGVLAQVSDKRACLPTQIFLGVLEKRNNTVIDVCLMNSLVELRRHPGHL